jgi:hypothetical protein
MSPNIPSDNRSVLVLNLAHNNLGALVLPGGWTEGYKADCLNKEYTHTDGRKQNLHPGKPEGIIALAAAIPGMGAMTKLDMSENHLGGSDTTSQGLRLLLAAVRACSTLQELNIAGNGFCSKDAPILAEAIKDMGALTRLIFQGDTYYGQVDGVGVWQDITPAGPAILEVGMTGADFNNKHLGAGDAIIISAWISHKDNGAMSVLILANNNIGGCISDGQFIATPEGIASFCVLCHTSLS